MKILITGNLGYIGTELTKFLSIHKKIQILGFDSGFFKSCFFRKKIKIKIIQHYEILENFQSKF